MNREAIRIPLLLLILLLLAAGSAPRRTGYIDPAAPSFRWPAVDLDADGVFDRIDRCPGTTTGCAVDKWGCSADRDQDGICDGRDQCPETPRHMKVDEDGCHAGALSSRVTEGTSEMPTEVTQPESSPIQISGPMTDVERQLVSRGRMRLDNVYFETGSAVLLPESENALDEAGQALTRLGDLEIEVEAHTDTRGATRYNQNLSQSRAEAVRDYLLRRFPLHAEKLKARGYGETRPETRERNQEERLRNRRVELRVLNPGVMRGYLGGD